MEKCSVCGKNSQKRLCSSCQKDPYAIEKYRSKLAGEGNLNELMKFYNNDLPEIKDFNTSEFWNKKLESKKKLQDEDGMTKDRINTVVSFIPNDTIKILDVGAGYGFFEEVIEEKGFNFELHGFDISSFAVKNLKSRFQGEFKIADIYHLSYERNYFDVIVALEVFEHIPPRKIFGVLNTLIQTLKFGGFLILSIPLNEGLHVGSENPSGHLRQYTPDLIKAELHIAGLKVVREKAIYAFRRFYALKSTLRTFIMKDRWQPNDLVIKAEKK